MKLDTCEHAALRQPSRGPGPDPLAKSARAARDLTGFDGRPNIKDGPAV
jgi:hypothetical protein